MQTRIPQPLLLVDKHRLLIFMHHLHLKMRFSDDAVYFFRVTPAFASHCLLQIPQILGYSTVLASVLVSDFISLSIS